MFTTIKKYIPRQFKNLLRKKIYHYRNYCPVCQNWVRSFEPFGIVNRPDAICPICGSLERQRGVWYFFEHKTNLFDRSPKSMLHIAPEKEFSRRLRRVSVLAYLSADLNDPEAMVKMDITDIPYPNNTFDVIYCSHVLEHVPDDRKAIRELFRVLKSDGWALLVVPITSEKTLEDPSVTDSMERLRLFGQEDHIRRYGPDFINRLEEAGFSIRSYTEAEIVGEENINMYGVTESPLFFCTKESG